MPVRKPSSTSGMAKIPPEYDGLGLTAVYYNRALALAGSWHSSLGTLLSAHQSIGVPEPVKLFGTDNRHALHRARRPQVLPGA